MSKLRLFFGGVVMLGAAIWAVHILWLGFETGTVIMPSRGGRWRVSFSDLPGAYLLLMGYWSLFPLFWLLNLYAAVTSRDARRRFIAMWRDAP